MTIDIHQKAKWMILSESLIIALMILYFIWFYNIIVGAFFIVFIISFFLGIIVLVLSILLSLKTSWKKIES